MEESTPSKRRHSNGSTTTLSYGKKKEEEMMKNNEMDGTTPVSSTKVYVSAEVMSNKTPQTSQRSPTPIKNQWLQHGVFFVCVCCLSAGLGVATYYGENMTQHITSQ